MDAVLADLQVNVARIVSSQIQGRVTSAPIVANKPEVPLPADTIFIDGSTKTALPAGTFVKFPGRWILHESQNIELLQYSETQKGNHANLNWNLDVFGNIFMSISLLHGSGQVSTVAPSRKGLVIKTVGTDTPFILCSLYIVRNYQAYPAAVHGLIRGAFRPGYDIPKPKDCPVSIMDNETMADDVFKWTKDYISQLLASNTFTNMLNDFEEKWRQDGLPFINTDNTDQDTDQDNAKTIEQQGMRDAARAREQVISTLREQVLALIADRATHDAAMEDAAKRQLQLTESLHKLSREKMDVDARLLKATQDREIDTSNAVLAETRRLNTELQALRSRIGSLEHSDIAELRLTVESERARADEAHGRAKSLQAELVRACQRSVDLDRELSSARARVSEAADKTAAFTAEITRLKKELADVCHRIDVIGRTDDVSPAVALFNQQLQEATTREKTLQSQLDAKTRACEAHEARLSRIVALIK